jgi:hypothetical protein
MRRYLSLFLAFITAAALTACASPAVAPAKTSAPVPYAPSLPSGFANADVTALLGSGTVHGLTTQESVELAVGLAENGKPDAAIVAAHLALGAAKTDREKAVLLATLSMLWGSKKEYRLAAETAEMGQGYLPDDPHLASLRFVYYDLAGDGVMTLAAKNHLMRLDPNFSRKPVFAIVDDLAEIELIAETIVALEQAWEHLPPSLKLQVHTELNEIGAWAKSFAREGPSP